MAEKKAKTAEKGKIVSNKKFCPKCKTKEVKNTLFAGYGRRGFFYACEDPGCGFVGKQL